MAGDYDKRSFLSGIAVGRQLKGWATGGNAGGGGSGSLVITENGTYDVMRYATAVVNVSSDIPVLQGARLVPEAVIVVDLSQLSPVVNINAKLVPESVFDVTNIVEQ